MPVDENCAEPLTIGQACEKAEDCVTASLKAADVDCMKARRYWVFDGGYCMVKSGDAPCPDGTRPFDVSEDRQNYTPAAFAVKFGLSNALN